MAAPRGAPGGRRPRQPARAAACPVGGWLRRFGGDSGALTAALAYAKRHGGGTVAVSSQSGARRRRSSTSGADVVALGGFSGRESEVDAAWLAEAVRDGQGPLGADDGGGRRVRGNDGRVGASALMAAVADTCTPVSVSAGGTTVALYDCQGNADALAAAAS